MKRNKMSRGAGWASGPKYKVDFEIEFLKHNYPGKFIVIEGIDGSGKTTQIKLLAEKLNGKGHKVWTTKNPTNYTIGRFIREQILTGKEKIPPQAIQYLYNADRVVQQEDIVEKLKEGYIVLSDRYFWSSVAYGMADLGSNSETLLTAYSILSFYHQFLLPDATFLLRTDADRALRRLREKNGREIYENKPFLGKAVKMYNLIVEKFPAAFTVIDGSLPAEKVTKEILAKVKNVLK